MGEEVSNQTEQHTLSVPEEDHPSLPEKESEKPDPPNAVINHDPNEKDSSPSPLVQNVADDAGKKDSGDSVDKDVADDAGKKDTGESVDKESVLARVVAEKRLALIKAWEESEKTKAENRAYKKFSAVGLWEDSRKASVEAQLKKIEENFERKKAECVEKMKNKVAEIHRLAEEKRAIVEAQKREEFLNLEETASKFRSRGNIPRKFFACFSG